MELEELLQLSTKNDRKAHYLLFKKVFPIIYLVCKRYYSNDQDIKSSVNMIFLKILNNLDSFIKSKKEIKTFDFWISRIAVNYIIDEYRKNKKYRESILLTSEYQNYNKHEDDFNLEKDLSSDVLDALHKIPSLSRTIFVMHTIDGFMHKEIAEKLQINENTCRVHYRNAKIKLKELLVKNRIVAVLVFLIIFLFEYQK